jgi:hypothetical protein
VLSLAISGGVYFLSSAVHDPAAVPARTFRRVNRAATDFRKTTDEWMEDLRLVRVLLDVGRLPIARSEMRSSTISMRPSRSSKEGGSRRRRLDALRGSTLAVSRQSEKRCAPTAGRT